MGNVKVTLEITKEVQETIDYVLKNEQDVNFKVCTECGRDLPCHNWFYSVQKQGKYGRDSKCKECISILRKNGSYKISNNLRELYYLSIKDNFCEKFRFMSIEQLQNEFELDINEVNMLIKRFNLNKKEILNSLTEKEIIFMYESLLNNKIKSYTNGIYNYDKYIIIMIKYMINNILKWNREDICNNFSLRIFKENGLGGLLGIKKFTLYDYLVKSFPEYNIMPWELKGSSVGNGWTEENINSALQWFKEKLLKDKNIDNINIAGTYSFKKLLDEYNFNGLCVTKFSGSSVLLFEAMFSEKFSKDEMLNERYMFDIDVNCVPTSLEGKVYKLNNSYYELDDRGKTLVNEVIRFCETEKLFPKEKDLSNNTGYICRTQFYKYFGENTLKQLYKYVSPVYDLSQETDVDNFRNIIDGQHYNVIFIKPNQIKCVECGEIKEFTEDNFPKADAQKFGLRYTCRPCDNKYVSRNNYKNKGIKFNNFDEISPQQWWEYVQNGNIRYLPEFCLEENNAIIIIRYVLLEKLKLSREEIKTINREFLKIYNIGHLYGVLFKTRLNFFNSCFPELEIKDFELDRLPYDEEMIDTIITNWIKDNNISVLNILKGEDDYRGNSKIYNMLMNTFISKYDMFIWYFKKHNIKHPSTKNIISVEDFDRMPPNYWMLSENRIKYVRRHCEEYGIFEYLHDTNLLKEWVFNNFRQEVLPVQINCFNISLYETLTESYPTIKDDKVLFDWEWHQFDKSDKQTLIRMLRELIEFRLDKYIINPIVDIPIYINGTFIKSVYPKFQHQIAKRRFDTYYQWCCEAYPEYVDSWKPEDFGLCVAFDGTRCGSIEEKTVYEFFKVETNLDIEAIGYQKSGEHIFILPEDHIDNKYCPDFVANQVNNNGNIVVFDKPLYIEYYGWYVENNPSKMFVEYVNKTDRKNEFFKNNSDILFLDIYPCDLKDNFRLLKNKYNMLINNSVRIV